MGQHSRQYDFDFIIVGSGFGGSVSALRLSEKGYRVAVMEMGSRWTPATLPKTSWSVHRWFWRPSLALRGFFSMRYFRHVTILHGCAVGGGSITYACTMLRPPEKVWDSGTWKGLADWKSEMPQHYDTASRMLGVAENRILGPSDKLLQRVANTVGIGGTFYRTSVAILQSPEGVAAGIDVPDPYFNGEGPDRTTCKGCGGCMMGCRHGAKNTLDLNYLYLAEKRGAKIFAETRVVDIRPLDGQVDGSAGYEVSTANSFSRFRGGQRRFTCRGIVVSASSLGTMELLFQLKDKGSLPAISDKLGRYVRTNSESLIGVRVPRSSDDLSKGVAIGSGVYIDEHTHIEVVRYPDKSDTMGMLATILTGGRPGPGRVALWLRNLIVSLVLHPFRTFRVLQPIGFARESVILLCMQALEGHIDMKWRATYLLALPEISGKPWPTGADVHSCCQRVCREVRTHRRRHRDEYAAGDSLRRSRHCALPGRLCDRSDAGRRCDRSSQPSFRLQEHVCLRWVGGGGEPGRKSQPDDHGAE